MATTVGMREFKDKASSYVERVEAGEVVTITKHGRPVARVIPAGITPGVAKLLSEGRLRWSGARPGLPRAVPLDGTGRSAAALVSEGRR